MPLNPFFLQGSASEQRLVQDLINEQLKIYGVDIFYMPRKFIGTDDVMKENIVARFDDSFALEAYVQNYEGFAGSGDLMTKFGVRTTDELTLVISRERYDDFVSVFYEDGTDETKLTSRPKEGDLIYFPLSDSLFEVKFVEHEQPFYQLGKLYMYQLTCELYEYEDAVIDTSIEEIDNNAEDDGYIATLTLAGVSFDGTANISLNNNAITNGAGYITDLVNDTSPQLGGTLDTNDQIISFGDSTGSTVNRLNFGAGNDLNIYHDGSDSYLRDSGTGQLNIWSNVTNILNSAGDEYCARFKENAEVELYHNNVMKLETESAGISVVGEGKFAGIVYPSANNTYNLGTTTNKWANVYATTLHGDGSNLTGISAGATGGGSDEIFYENGQNVTTDYTITNGKNAMSAGPITIDSGVTVTVGSGETLTIV